MEVLARFFWDSMGVVVGWRRSGLDFGRLSWWRWREKVGGSVRLGLGTWPEHGGQGFSGRGH